MARKKTKIVTLELVFRLQVVAPEESNLDDLDDVMGNLSLIMSPGSGHIDIQDANLSNWKVIDA